MKNLRIAKKDPAKILKILETTHPNQQQQLLLQKQSPHKERYDSLIIRNSLEKSAKKKPTNPNQRAGEKPVAFLYTERKSHFNISDRYEPNNSRSFHHNNSKKRRNLSNQLSERSAEKAKDTAINLHVGQGAPVHSSRNSQAEKEKGRYQHSPYLERQKSKNNNQSQNSYIFQSENLKEKSKKYLKNTSKVLSLSKQKQIKRKDVANFQTKPLSNRKQNISVRLNSLNENPSHAKKLSGDEQTLESVKMLMSKGDHRKALLLLKSCEKTPPDNKQSHYLSAICWYNLNQLQKSIELMQKIIEQQPSYNVECYKILAVCFFKNLAYTKSLSILENCHKYFLTNAESYALEGKILIKMQKYNEAILSYEKACKYNENIEYLVNQAICYENLQRYEEAMNVYGEVMKGQCSSRYLLRVVSIQKRIQRWVQIVQQVQRFQQQKKGYQSMKQKAQIYYLYAYSLYKLNRQSNALIAIEDGIRCNQLPEIYHFYKLHLMVNIQQRDFYQAHHATLRITEFYTHHRMNQVLLRDDLRIILVFVDGVFNLMRKNYGEGLTLLLSIQHSLCINAVPGYCSSLSEKLESSSQKQKQKRTNEIKNKVDHMDEFLFNIRKIYLSFLSYGYYCVGEFPSCIKFITMQIQDIGISQKFKEGLIYNLKMSEGITYHLKKSFQDADLFFIEADQIYQKRKLEPVFCRAINFVQILRHYEYQDQYSEKNYEKQKKNAIIKGKQCFEAAQIIIESLTNNLSANVFYHKSVFYGYLEEWKQALLAIDQSIDRSEDHYWRYFYVRAMLFACIHSFRQAVNEVSIAINLSNGQRPECFLLRSKCLQIEGQGSQAFKDLQEYIALKPEDKNIHKFAGQLLFQNGAFEDAIAAFSHQIIQEKNQNFDILITQAKSYFLLGKFEEAALIMKKAAQVKGNSTDLIFDSNIFEVLHSMVKSQNSFEDNQKKIKTIYQGGEEGRIFKKIDQLILCGLCNFYSNKYDLACQYFKNSIKQKQIESKSNLNEMKQLDELDEELKQGKVEHQKDTETFRNQMKYNVMLCYLKLLLKQEAIEVISGIYLDEELPFYKDFVDFRNYLQGESTVPYSKKQIFPSRNKLSNFFPTVELLIESQATLNLKLCIPFPKVEPPEIFPEFDKELVERMTALNVQRKPEAPWVIRENKSIRFTEKIQNFDRLELQDSSMASSSTYQIIEIDQTHLDGNSRRSLRSALKLDTEIEQRLDKLMNKKKKGK